MDDLETAATKATIELLRRATEPGIRGDEAEQFASAAVGTTNIVTLAAHNKRDAERRNEGGFLN